MTVILHLSPESEAGLLAQAQASGMTVEAYLESVIEGALLPRMQETASAEERAAAFEYGLRAIATAVPRPITP